MNESSVLQHKQNGEIVKVAGNWMEESGNSADLKSEAVVFHTGAFSRQVSVNNDPTFSQFPLIDLTNSFENLIQPAIHVHRS